MAKSKNVPIAQIGPNLALLVIDVQVSLFYKSTPIYQADMLLEKLTGLVEHAHQSGEKVIFVQHSSESYMPYGSNGWQLHPTLQPFPDDLHVFKTHPSAFDETNLQEVLDQNGIGTLVLAGLVTHGCVKATCLDALARGYRTILVKDGHSSYSPQAAELIEKWNDHLAKSGAELVSAGALLNVIG